MSTEAQTPAQDPTAPQLERIPTPRGLQAHREELEELESVRLRARLASERPGCPQARELLKVAASIVRRSRELLEDDLREAETSRWIQLKTDGLETDLERFRRLA